jgi:hypothetical protein
MTTPQTLNEFLHASTTWELGLLDEDGNELTPQNAPGYQRVDLTTATQWTVLPVRIDDAVIGYKVAALGPIAFAKATGSWPVVHGFVVVCDGLPVASKKLPRVLVIEDHMTATVEDYEFGLW